MICRRRRGCRIVVVKIVNDIVEFLVDALLLDFELLIC